MGFISSYRFPSIKGSQGKNLRQKLEMEYRETLPTSLYPGLRLAAFLKQSRPTFLGIVLPIMVWTLLHQLRKAPQELELQLSD